MATVNLGRIKFVWQGAYSGATAYVADDVVSYNGSSYICILASTNNLPTNATYWSLMAQSGTDITSLAGLAQGDVLYYNGTSWVRLGAGTSGQFLKTNGSGANPAWATVQPSAIAQVVINSSTTITTNTSQSTYVTGAPSITITPTSASNKIYVEWHLHTRANPTTAADTGFQFEIYRGATLLSTSSDGRSYLYGHSSDINQRSITQLAYYDTSHNTTSAITYTFKFRNVHSTREIAVGNTGSAINEISWVKAFELI